MAINLNVRERWGSAAGSVRGIGKRARSVQNAAPRTGNWGRRAAGPTLTAPFRSVDSAGVARPGAPAGQPARGGTGALAAMGAFTLASGWIGVGVNRILGEPDGMESPGTLLWLAGPLVGVAAVRLLRKSTAPAGWNPRLPAQWPWYVAALATFPADQAINVGLGAGTGYVDASGFDLRALAATAASLIGVNLVKNFFEETVWRGYFTSEFIQRGWSDAKIYLAAGLVWGLWHVPYYLFFLPEAELRTVLDVAPPVFAGLGTLTMLAWGVAFTELFRVSGSVWPVVVLHAVEGAFVNNLLFDGHIRTEGSSALVFSPVVGLLPAALLAGAGLALRHHRRRRA